MSDQCLRPKPDGSPCCRDCHAETTVVHWLDRPAPGEYVYIGRNVGDGYFGNPYIVGRDGDRHEVLMKYKQYFLRRVLTDPEFYHRVQALKGRVLVCHCKPRDCHGDIIASYLNAALDGSPSSLILSDS